METQDQKNVAYTEAINKLEAFSIQISVIKDVQEAEELAKNHSAMLNENIMKMLENPQLEDPETMEQTFHHRELLRNQINEILQRQYVPNHLLHQLFHQRELIRNQINEILQRQYVPNAKN